VVPLGDNIRPGRASASADGAMIARLSSQDSRDWTRVSQALAELPDATRKGIGAVGHDGEPIAHLVLFERFARHQHVARVVLDEQNLDRRAFVVSGRHFGNSFSGRC